jgi:hypothetical protein
MMTVPADDMARLLTALRDDFGGSVEALLTAARRSAAASRRSPSQPVAFRSATEVQEAVAMKLITREEARRLLGLRPVPSRRRRPVVVVTRAGQEGQR